VAQVGVDVTLKEMEQQGQLDKEALVAELSQMLLVGEVEVEGLELETLIEALTTVVLVVKE
jgi:hypothetical protein